MITERHLIEVAGIPVEIVRKDIKNLHVGVYPPNGRVRVAAPVRLDDEAVRLALISRLGWIRRQQAQFIQQDRQSRREFVTGETHYFRGRRYRLDVVERVGPSSVSIPHNSIIRMCIQPKAGLARREIVLHEWYRSQIKQRLPVLLAKWQARIGVTVAQVGVKKMRTRWGSCNAGARRIWLNLELAKKPESCLEYIVVHEMVHILERHHNERFSGLMNTFMPSWRSLREELNRAPLAHEHWDY